MENAERGVVAADIASLPLGDGTVDVVVFCLSLMGSNFQDFVVEAGRVLRSGGTLLIAEVRSRFEDLGEAAFLARLAQLGFEHAARSSLRHNSHFFEWELRKRSGSSESSSQKRASREKMTLKPCIYKRR